MYDVARHVRARGTHLLSTRTTPASVGTFILALLFVIIIDVDMTVVGCGCGLLERRGEGCRSRSGRRSHRRAAAPSPPAPGPSAGSRSPVAAAIWRLVALVTERRAFGRRFVRNAMFVHALPCQYVGCG